jgi:hypothetical protein
MLLCWKANHLSYGGRLTLINLVLSCLPMFMMSIFEISKVFIDHGSTGKGIHIRKSITWQNGTSCVDQKIKVG